QNSSFGDAPSQAQARSELVPAILAPAVLVRRYHDVIAERHVLQTVARNARRDPRLVTSGRQLAAADLPIAGEQIRTIVHSRVQVGVVDVIEAQSGGDGDARSHLPFVLDISSPGADIEVGVAGSEPGAGVAGRK